MPSSPTVIPAQAGTHNTVQLFITLKGLILNAQLDGTDSRSPLSNDRAYASLVDFASPSVARYA